MLILEMFFTSILKKNSDSVGQNFWNYFFVQNQKIESNIKVLNIRYETFPLRVWDRHFFRDMHRFGVTNIDLRTEIKDEVLNIKKMISSKKTLGVHVRRTDHRWEIKPAEDKVYFNLIEKNIKNFEKLFLATDDIAVFEMFKMKYGSKLIYQDCTRSSDPDNSIHHNPENTDGYEIGKQALLDCYSLSFCEKVILSPSNLSYSVLLLNPNLKYEIAESFDAKKKRLKTAAVYVFHKWGIRKW